MRTSALIALLPFLATLPAQARPHPSDHVRAVDQQGYIRKSLSFGPRHDHASFEVLDVQPVDQVMGLREIDAKEVAKAFIAHKVGGGEGVSFYIREDVSSIQAVLKSR